MADFIFHDPSGRRARRARLGVGFLISLAALVVAGKVNDLREGTALAAAAIDKGTAKATLEKLIAVSKEAS